MNFASDNPFKIDIFVNKNKLVGSVQIHTPTPSPAVIIHYPVQLKAKAHAKKQEFMKYWSNQRLSNTNVLPSSTVSLALVLISPTPLVAVHS